MAEELVGNCLVAQSGGPTSVINASVAGVVNEALEHECIEEIYGGLNGVLGILKEDLIDLAEESQQNIRGLRYTPAAGLGTCRFKLKRQEDYNRVLEVFEAHNIRYFFYAGLPSNVATRCVPSEYLRRLTTTLLSPTTARGMAA
jgi:6-phosphofructokinase